MGRPSYSSLIGGGILGLLLALGAAGIFYSQGYRFMRHEVPAAKMERTIICYKSPQDPTFMSDKPGKDPQGNELVPGVCRSTSLLPGFPDQRRAQN